MSSPYTPNTTTRQQLDELDALLQRMLALPLNNAGEADAGRPAPAEATIPLPPTRPTLPQPVVRSTPSAAGPAPGEPAVQGWRVELPPGAQGYGPWPSAAGTPEAPTGLPPGATVTRFESPLASMPAPTLPPPMIFGQGAAPVTPATAAYPAPVMPEPPPVPAHPHPRPAPAEAKLPPLPVGLWPVFLLNKLFDGVCCTFGPFGRWLTWTGPRNLMGWLGVLMILAAIGWGVAEWHGFDWTW